MQLTYSLPAVCLEITNGRVSVVIQQKEIINGVLSLFIHKNNRVYKYIREHLLKFNNTPLGLFCCKLIVRISYPKRSSIPYQNFHRLNEWRILTWKYPFIMMPFQVEKYKEGNTRPSPVI